MAAPLMQNWTNMRDTDSSDVAGDIESLNNSRSTAPAGAVETEDTLRSRTAAL